MRIVLDQPEHRLVDRVLYRYLSHPGSLTFSDRDMRDKLSPHLLTVARTRLAESPAGTPMRAAYRRWHAWATGYGSRATPAAAWPRRRHRAGWRKADAAWPLRFLADLPEHWRDREVRCGTP